jgi:hypothetical protein
MVPFEFEEFEKFEDDSVFDDAVKRGSYILAYSKTVIKKVCEKAASRKLDGKDVLVVNASHWMSEIGSRLAPDCDFAMIWYYDHNDKDIKVERFTTQLTFQKFLKSLAAVATRRQQDSGFQATTLLTKFLINQKSLPEERVRRGKIKMRPEWDEIWANFAKQISRRSVDPKYKVGAVIVNDENTQVLSIGYNGDQIQQSKKKKDVCNSFTLRDVCKENN